jgi:hypothetical protein
VGWLNERSQQQIFQLFGRSALYICDRCGRPIWAGELPVVRPKGGYYELPKSVNQYGSRYSRPKLTYCQDCDRIRRGLEPRGAETATTPTEPTMDDVKKWVMKLITKRPDKGWKVFMVVKRLRSRAEGKMISTAIRELKQVGKLKRIKRCLIPAKISKKGDAR